MLKNIYLATTSLSRINVVKSNNLKWNCVPNLFEEENAKTNLKKPLSLQDSFDYTKMLSIGKARSIENYYKNSIIIACDTVIFANDKVLEKPKTREEAFMMYDLLNGTLQSVITGVSIIDSSNNHYKQFNVVTDLIFTDLNIERQQKLFNDGEPYDHAGGYTLGVVLDPITQIINGERENILGLPIKEIIKELKYFDKKVNDD